MENISSLYEISIYLDENNYEDIFNNFDIKILDSHIDSIYQIILTEIPNNLEYFLEKLPIKDLNLIKIIILYLENINYKVVFKILEDKIKLSMFFSQLNINFEKFLNKRMNINYLLKFKELISSCRYRNNIKKILINYFNAYKEIKNYERSYNNILIFFDLVKNLFTKEEILKYKHYIIWIIFSSKLNFTQYIELFKSIDINMNTTDKIYNYILEENNILKILCQNNNEIILLWFLNKKKMDININNYYFLLKNFITTKNIKLIKKIYIEIKNSNIEIHPNTYNELIFILLYNNTERDTELIIKEFINLGYYNPKPTSQYYSYKKSISLIK